ncbi:hypothetical protein R50345_22665 [Paenibacillus sp. FSL R5-0345]|uniref:hypothetical protein n=1 Tax=Paenibacillus sp. FSL R5-0345 TaxID=1536770 RepID=UPI0004F784A3|nr:hypothetical protein [Paenibacillus sp. FSL R5-0345]AIQ37193.1 hypothetical protein R50345_22665 [Paenibacillus sp. FSL R5-0345]
MRSNKSKGISLFGIVVVVLLGIFFGTNAMKSPGTEVIPAHVSSSGDGIPFFTPDTLQNEMEYNYSETTWYPLINYYLISDEDKTIKIILNKAKKEVAKETAQSISGAVASLTYNEGRTNYLVYKVVDNNNQVVYSFDRLKQNAEKMTAKLKEIYKQADGIILKIKPRENSWSQIDVTVSDTWYYSQDFQKERFVETYGTLISQVILDYKYIITGDERVYVYFVDEFGTRLASPKLFEGWKVEN